MTFRYDYAASWGWFFTLNQLTNDDITKHNQVLSMDAEHVLVQLTFLIDKSKNS
jgi:hypothetical protein